MPRIFYAGFAVLVGLSMIAIWIMLLITNQVSELVTSPLTITFHLIAEFVTGISLIVGGIALYGKYVLGVKIYLVSLGMLLYTVINSSGYYAQRGDWSFVFMFGVIFVLAVICCVGLLIKKIEY